MLKNALIIYILLLVPHSLIDGLESHSKQRQNPNADFLLHEAGAVPFGEPKRDYVNPLREQPQQTPGRQDYDSQFPPLGSNAAPKQTVRPSSPTPTTSIPSGKRDYVAPSHSTFPPSGSHSTPKQTVRPSSPTPTSSIPSGKRDYVAPTHSTFPPSGSHSTPIQTVRPSSPMPTTSIPSGKRDYVAPTRSTSSPMGPSKVKDLVNFYDSKNKDQNDPPKGSSYSSILQNVGNNRNDAVINNVNTKPNQPPVTNMNVWSDPHKNPSFSHTETTKKPTAIQTPPSPTSSKNPPRSPRPSTPVLPSSVLNNNRNKPGNNGMEVSDNEIETLSEELLRKDVNNAAKYVTVNYQERTTAGSKEDKAPQPLLTVAPDAWNIPTIVKFIPLLDNYERDTLVNEHVTPQERNEENAFMDAIMSTSVIRHLMNFLKEKGYVTLDPRQQRDFLKQLWFSLYSRGKGKISSSGFEHIFVSELKNGEVSGLHNWIYFSKEEAANRVNYLGYLKYSQFNDKGVVLKLHFNQLGVDKPVDTMFIGTSPELEIALYTLCFVTRADNDCKLKLGNKDVNIVTHTFRYRSKNLIGSAYPQI